MQAIIDAFAKAKILPIVTLSSEDHALRLTETLLSAGIPVLEITFRTEKAPLAVAAIRKRFPEVLIGAGTILKPQQAEQAAESGAQFVLTPGFNPQMAAKIQALALPYFPGVQTPTEIELALEAGFTYLKLFPAEAAGGYALLKALAGPFPQIRFLPTGGLNLQNMGPYLSHKSVLACGSGDLAPSDLIERQDWAEIRERALQYRKLASSFFS